MILVDFTIVLLLTALASGGGVTMMSRRTPYQMTFGADGRLRMEDLDEKIACGYDEKITAEEKPHSTELGFEEEPATTGGQQDYSNESPRPACATNQSTSIDNVRIPADGSNIVLPVRLDFTLKNPKSNLIEMRFMKSKSKIYVVEFRRGEGIELEHESATLNLQFDESHRFWVTCEHGEVKVGLHSNDSPLVHYKDPDFTTDEVEFIELWSKTKNPTEWKFYEPCTFEA